MKKILLSLMLGLATLSVAHATENVINTQGNLTDAQKAELAATAAKMVAENTSDKIDPAAPGKSVAVVKQWVDIGTAIGSGLAASAKELGIAANQFAETPVGRFTVFLIAWHFIGGTLLHVFFALLWFFIMTGIFVWMYRRASLEKTITYYEKGQGPDGKSKVVTRTPKVIGENLGASMMAGAAVSIIIFVVMLLNL